MAWGHSTTRRVTLLVGAATVAIGCATSALAVPQAAFGATGSSQTPCAGGGSTPIAGLPIGVALPSGGPAGSIAGGTSTCLSPTGAGAPVSSPPPGASPASAPSPTISGVKGAICGAFDRLAGGAAQLPADGGTLPNTFSDATGQLAGQAGCATTTAGPGLTDGSPATATSTSGSSPVGPGSPLCTALAAVAAAVGQLPQAGSQLQGGMREVASALQCSGGAPSVSPLCSVLAQVGAALAQVPQVASPVTTALAQIDGALGCPAPPVGGSLPSGALAVMSAPVALPAHAVLAAANFTG